MKSENSWRSINRRLLAMNEEELKTMLDAELVGQRRVFVAERLHQRLTTVRSARERQAIMAQLKESEDGNN